MSAVTSESVTVYGVPVKSRILFEISVGGTSVLLDWQSARAVLADLNTQFDTSEIIRINVDCVNSSSKISNFPLSRNEVRRLLHDLDWYVNA
jgi:hypothetical protein